MRATIAGLGIGLVLATVSVGSWADGAPRPDALLMVDQHREAIVDRVVKAWPETLTSEQAEALRKTLWTLRADRLLAVSITPSLNGLLSVFGAADRVAEREKVARAAAKTLGDTNADVTYTPVNPCRILDTRSTVAGPLTSNVARTFDGYSTNFATQGGTGSGCGIPNGVAALAMNVYAVNPTNLGFIKVWPASGTEPDVSTVNYQVGITAIATGAIVPVDSVNSNRFLAKSPAQVDFIADAVGYFRAPIGQGAVWVDSNGKFLGPSYGDNRVLVTIGTERFLLALKQFSAPYASPFGARWDTATVQVQYSTNNCSGPGYIYSNWYGVQNVSSIINIAGRYYLFVSTGSLDSHSYGSAYHENGYCVSFSSRTDVGYAVGPPVDVTDMWSPPFYLR